MKRIYTEEQKERKRAYSKAYYAAHCDRMRAASKSNRAENLERARATEKAYAKANRERKRASCKAYYAANREDARAKQKVYREKHRERARAVSKAWREVNPEYGRVRSAKLYQSDINYKIRLRCRSLIRQALRKEGSQKNHETMQLSGCDIDWLRAWLEVQFQFGMSWENYGPVWHIDHKRPCASFDLTDPRQQRRCFHWTNLQPLFAAENISKGARWEGEAA